MPLSRAGAVECVTAGASSQAVTMRVMPDEPREQEPEHEGKKPLGERIREHILAAEVAAEESAGYGAVTTAVEAGETAIDPQHELGEGPDAPRDAPSEPAHTEQAETQPER